MKDEAQCMPELFLSLFKGRPDLELGKGGRKGRQGMSEPMSGGLKRKVSLSGSLSLHLDLGFRDLTKT